MHEQYVANNAKPDELPAAIAPRALAQVDATARCPTWNRADLRIGDLVFHDNDLSHVTIYVGDGKVIRAPMPGDVVWMQTLDAGSPIHGFGRPG